MDAVQYDFVDRVFTMLKADDIATISLKSPIWNQVKRVYNTKLQNYTVSVCFTNQELRYKIYSKKEEDVPLTLEDVLQLDARFNRVNEFYVESATRPLPHLLAVDRLPELLDYVSRFNLKAVFLDDFEKTSTVLLNRIAKIANFRTEFLCITSFPGAEGFLKKQLGNGVLDSLRAYDFAPEPLKADLEAFVCHPNFKQLHSEIDCFDKAAMKRIFASWMKTKPAQAQSIRIKLNRNLSRILPDL